jgi:hypothetical protein
MWRRHHDVESDGHRDDHDISADDSTDDLVAERYAVGHLHRRRFGHRGQRRIRDRQPLAVDVHEQPRVDRHLAGAASASDDSQCSQTITVKPSTTYTLSAWVDGAYVYLGDTGTGATDTSTWTPGTSGYQQLSTTFTTGASTTSLSIWLHGWYGQGTYYADDVAVVVG